MKKLYYWFIDKLFDEKINSIICWTILALAGIFILMQALRGLGYILIA